MTQEELTVVPTELEDFMRIYPPTRGRTLVVGSRIYDKPDRRLMYDPPALGVDMLPGPGVDAVLNLEERLPADFGPFEHIDCVSVLEHSKRPWKLAANLERLLTIGGSLLVSTPFVWRIHAYPSDYFRFTPAGIRVLFPHIRWRRLALQHWALYPERDYKNEVKLPTRTDEEGLWMLKTETWGFGKRTR